MGLQIQVLNASTSREIDAAFSSLAHDRPDALYIGAEQLFTLRSVQLVQLAARLAVPATYSGRQFANIGGLMTYAADITDAYRQVGVYTGRILKGAKPASVAEDPVRSGLVASLARPGGNLTGINLLSVEVGTKRLELLRELVPGAVKVAVLVDPATPVTETTLREVEMAARSMGAARGAGAAAGDAGDRVSHARIGRLVVTPCGH